VSRRRITKAQKTLQRLHGTVDEFTDAVIRAIGDIGIDEALAAIREYRLRWEAAGFKGNIGSNTTET
jgi:hypothetical protein